MTLKAAAVLLLAVSVAAQEKANIRFYGESLCPFCQATVPLFAEAVATPGISEILDFQYVAYGNAQWNGGNVQCQHGPNECFGNIAENCATNVTAYNPVKYLPFVQCVENGQQITQALVDTCLAKSNIEAAKVNSCIKGPLGKVLEEQAYKATPPAHTYVPWVVGPDGKTFDVNTKQDIIDAACNFWKGTKPSFCSKQKASLKRCYNENL